MEDGFRIALNTVLDHYAAHEFARTPAAGQGQFDFEKSHPRESDAHDGKRPGEFAPKTETAAVKPAKPMKPALIAAYRSVLDGLKGAFDPKISNAVTEAIAHGNQQSSDPDQSVMIAVAKLKSDDPERFGFIDSEAASQAKAESAYASKKQSAQDGGRSYPGKASNVDREAVPVYWRRYLDSGGTGPVGQTHLMFDGEDKTLCGIVIPSSEVADVESTVGHANCRRCMSIDKKMDGYR